MGLGEDKLISYNALLKDIQNTITENSTFLDWMNLIYRQPSIDIDISSELGSESDIETER